MYSIDPVPGYGFFHGYVGVKGISYESVQGGGTISLEKISTREVDLQVCRLKMKQQQSGLDCYDRCFNVQTVFLQ